MVEFKHFFFARCTGSEHNGTCYVPQAVNSVASNRTSERHPEEMVILGLQSYYCHETDKDFSQAHPHPYTCAYFLSPEFFRIASVTIRLNKTHFIFP